MHQNASDGRKLTGFLLVILSLAGFGFMQIFAAMTSDEIPVIEQIFFRNLFCFFAVGGLIAARGMKPAYGPRRYFPYLTARSISGFFGVMCLLYAARNAPQSTVSVISRTEIFTISAVSVIFLGERLTKMHLPALAVAFAGAFIAAAPRFDSSALPMLAALGVSLANTVSYPILSYLSGKVSPLSSVLFFCTFSTALSSVLMMPTFVVPTGWDLFCVSMLGISAAVGQLAMTFAYNWIPAGEMSIYNQMSIVMNSALAFVMLGQMPSFRTVVGAALVLAASVALFWYKQRHAEQ